MSPVLCQIGEEFLPVRRIAERYWVGPIVQISRANRRPTGAIANICGDAAPGGTPIASAVSRSAWDRSIRAVLKNRTEIVFAAKKHDLRIGDETNPAAWFLRSPSAAPDRRCEFGPWRMRIRTPQRHADMRGSTGASAAACDRGNRGTGVHFPSGRCRSGGHASANSRTTEFRLRLQEREGFRQDRGDILHALVVRKATLRAGACRDRSRAGAGSQASSLRRRKWWRCSSGKRSG